MRIIADNNITDADITATNTLSFQDEEQLKIFQLAERFSTSTNNTDISLDFGTNIPVVDAIALCGTNLSEDSTINISYSNISPDIPEATIPITEFSTFNQILFLDVAQSKRYWVISISDPNPNNDDGSSRLSLGYIYIGKYTQIDYVEYPSEPSANYQSIGSSSYTRQRFGSRGYRYFTSTFTCTDLTYTDLEELIDLIDSKQNVEPVVLVEYEDNYTMSLYRPKYGYLATTEYQFPMQTSSGDYTLSFSFEETF